MYTKKKFAWPSDRSLDEIVPVYIRFRVFDVHSSYIDTYYTVWVGSIEIPFNQCKVILNPNQVTLNPCGVRFLVIADI